MTLPLEESLQTYGLFLRLLINSSKLTEETKNGLFVEQPNSTQSMADSTGNGFFWPTDAELRSAIFGASPD